LPIFRQKELAIHSDAAEQYNPQMNRPAATGVNRDGEVTRACVLFWTIDASLIYYHGNVSF